LLSLQVIVCCEVVIVDEVAGRRVAWGGVCAVVIHRTKTAGLFAFRDWCELRPAMPCR